MITEPLEFEKPIVNLERQLAELRDRAADSDIDMSSEMKRIEDKLTKTKTDIYRNLSSWQRVQIARHQQRPFMLDYVEHSFDDFLELHGDRHVGDDEAMPGGFAYLEGRKVMVIWTPERFVTPRKTSAAISEVLIPKDTARLSA